MSATGTLTLESSLPSQPQEWPESDRPAEQAREAEFLAPLAQDLAQSTAEVKTMLFAASASNFGGPVLDSSIGALLSLDLGRRRELINAADPDRFDEFLWLRLAAAGLGGPAAEVAAARLGGAQGRKKSLLLDLARFGPAAVAAPPIQQALEDPDPLVRRAAASALAALLGEQRGDEPGRLRQLEACVLWLDDHRRSTGTVVEAMGLVRLPELYSYLGFGPEAPASARASLLRAAGSPFDTVSREAVAAFGLELAKHAGERDEALAREFAAGRRFHESSCAALRRLAEDPDPNVRAAAASSAGQLVCREDQVAWALADVDSAVREAAAAALGRMGPNGLAALEDLVKSTEAASRLLAVVGISQSPEPRAIAILRGALRDEDELVRLTAASAPSAFQTALAARKPELLEDLERLAEEDPSPSVRAAARVAIAAIAPAPLPKSP